MPFVNLCQVAKHVKGDNDAPFPDLFLSSIPTAGDDDMRFPVSLLINPTPGWGLQHILPTPLKPVNKCHLRRQGGKPYNDADL